MALKEKVETMFGKKDDSKPKAKKGDINILMVGGRRTGKTSILASMAQCCMKKLAGVEQLSIVRDEDSGIGLTTKYTELNQYFTKKYMSKPYFIADLQPTIKDATYGFDVGVDGKDLGYNLCFTDIPGEWLDNPAHEQDLQNAMDISQVIIVAIDTPHLVEEIDPALGYGKYHESFNRVKELTRFFKQTFQSGSGHRLVIFVPLKCEKYYYMNEDNAQKLGMPMVNRMVKQGYHELIQYLTKSDVQEVCTCAIMPILTLGGAEFFEFDDNGYAGLYSYVLDPVHRKFNPQFCEQPLFLTLQYVIAMAKKYKEAHKFGTLLKELFQNQAKLEALVKCENTLKGLIMTDSNLGYEILNDPMKMLR